MQREYSINYFWYKINLQKIKPQMVQIKRYQLLTISDFQWLLGENSYLHPTIGIDHDELSNLFSTQEWDKDLNSLIELLSKAEQRLALVENKL